MILEAFAERIVRLGAHRSSWRNGISEGSHKSFCSQPVVRAAAYPISFKWKLASRREKNLDRCCCAQILPSLRSDRIRGFVCCYRIAFRWLNPSLSTSAAYRKPLLLICRLHVDRTSFDFYILHGLKDIFAILTWNFYEGVFVVHVNCADQFSRHSGFSGDRA